VSTRKLLAVALAVAAAVAAAAVANLALLGLAVRRNDPVGHLSPASLSIPATRPASPAAPPPLPVTTTGEHELPDD
jgi:hypothetical protein